VGVAAVCAVFDDGGGMWGGSGKCTLTPVSPVSRVDIDGDDPTQIERLREFLRESPMVGRTEIQLDPDTALGMRRPERYRYELIDAIAADSQRLRKTMGEGCEVALDGLNSRIEW